MHHQNQLLVKLHIDVQKLLRPLLIFVLSLLRTKVYSLFKFEASYHAMTMNSYLMEQAAGQGGDGLDAGLSVTGRQLSFFPAVAEIASAYTYQLH